MSDMWRWWKEKCGSHVAALESQYPVMLASTEELRFCVSQIKQAEARIDQIVEQHEDNEDLVE